MNETVHVGHTGNDEMCNLYLMFYADLPTAMTCYNDRLSIHTGVRTLLVPSSSGQSVWCRHNPIRHHRL
jgi:hypothetical protein